jgi:DNA excision repair protein ERCC-3
MQLLHDAVIKKAWIKDSLPLDEKINIKPKIDDFSGAVITLDREDEEGDEDDVGADFITSFEIDSRQAEEVKKRCVELDYPLMEEYDFRQDTLNANLDMDLSPKTSNNCY